MIKGIGDFEVSLSGGEPTLELDLCNQVVGLCKKNNIVTTLITNGWWGNNKEIIRHIKNMPLNYILVSVDKYHQKFIDISIIKNLIKEFENEQAIIFIQTIINELRNPYQDPCIALIRKRLERKDIGIMGALLNKSANCSIKNGECNLLLGTNVPIGFRFEYDGVLKASCRYGIGGCEVGDILTNPADAWKKINALPCNVKWEI
jgi:hypothetical protein